MGDKGNNVNDNEIGNLKSNNNDNVNDKSKHYAKGRHVEITADELMRKFKPFGVTEQSRLFMLRAAWNLSEARLWTNVEQALKGTNPMGLFIYLCKRDGV